VDIVGSVWFGVVGLVVVLRECDAISRYILGKVESDVCARAEGLGFRWGRIDMGFCLG
jgi:hypothetical protein